VVLVSIGIEQRLHLEIRPGLGCDLGKLRLVRRRMTASLAATREYDAAVAQVTSARGPLGLAGRIRFLPLNDRLLVLRGFRLRNLDDIRDRSVVTNHVEDARLRFRWRLDRLRRT
jgi:hypothetical protein